MKGILAGRRVEHRYGVTGMLWDQSVQTCRYDFLLSSWCQKKRACGVGVRSLNASNVLLKPVPGLLQVQQKVRPSSLPSWSTLQNAGFFSFKGISSNPQFLQ